MFRLTDRIGAFIARTRLRFYGLIAVFALTPFAWVYLVLHLIMLAWLSAGPTTPRQLEWIQTRGNIVAWMLLIMPVLWIWAGCVLFLARRHRKETIDYNAIPCKSCGYDLRGSTGDACPECGKEHSSSP